MSKGKLTLLFINEKYRVRRYLLSRLTPLWIACLLLVVVGTSFYLGMSAGSGVGAGNGDELERLEELQKDLAQADRTRAELEEALALAEQERETARAGYSALEEELRALEARLVDLERTAEQASGSDDNGSVPGRPIYGAEDLDKLFPFADRKIVNIGQLSISPTGGSQFNLEVEVSNSGVEDMVRGQVFVSLVLESGETVDMKLLASEATFLIRYYKKVNSPVRPGEELARAIGWVVTVKNSEGELLYRDTLPLEQH